MQIFPLFHARCFSTFFSSRILKALYPPPSLGERGKDERKKGTEKRKSGSGARMVRAFGRATEFWR